MDYEKTYKEALKKAKRLYEQGTITESLAHIFPELKESEGEGIRKNIISFLRSKNGYMNPDEDWDFHNRWLPWLEKQKDTNVLIQEASEKAYTEGMRVERKHWLEKQEESTLIKEIKRRKELFSQEKEKAVSSNDKLSLGARIAMLEELLVFVKEKQGKQTPTSDNIETKFHEGEFIVNHCGTLRYIERVDSTGYQTDGGWLLHNEYEKFFHLWTIADAKDGDVLELDCGIGIFKDKCMDGYNIHCYCYYSNEGILEIDEDSLYDIYQSNPATKEQRDTLFAKINEAGYEWDAEKKELKKIEEDGVAYKKQVMSEMANLATTYVKQKSQPAWSEKDEEELGIAIKYLQQAGQWDSATWLKSLKERL